MIDEKHASDLRAIRAICALAQSNFPAATDVWLSVDGAATGSVRVPWYVLEGLLDRPERKKR